MPDKQSADDESAPVSRRYVLELAGGGAVSISLLPTGTAARREPTQTASTGFGIGGYGHGGYGGTTDTTQSVEAAIAGADGRINTAELRDAISYWVSDTTVPNTGGRRIDTATLRTIIRLWVTDQPV